MTQRSKRRRGEADAQEGPDDESRHERRESQPPPFSMPAHQRDETVIQGNTGHHGDQSPDFLTTSDHSYPRTAPLPVVGNCTGAADAEGILPDPLHDHCLAGFQEAAEAALAEKGITDEARAALIEGARTRYGWTLAEVAEWVEARHKA